MDFQQSYTYTDPSTSKLVNRLISGMQTGPLTPTANQYANNHLTTTGNNLRVRQRDLSAIGFRTVLDGENLNRIAVILEANSVRADA